MPRFFAGLFVSAMIGVMACPAPAFLEFAQKKGPIEARPTLIFNFNQADFVLVGTLSNPILSKVASSIGTTDLTIESVLKSNPLIKDRKTITISGYFPDAKNKFVLFCSLNIKGDIVPNVITQRAVELKPGNNLVTYLTGAIALRGKSPPERLRYCFDFLNNPDSVIALDAYLEFAKAAYKDYRDIAKQFPPDTLAELLKDEKSTPSRSAFYAFLLGHCGKAEHAKLLRAYIDDPENRNKSGIDRALAGYVIIQPKEGWTYLTNLLQDSNEEYYQRYSGQLALRFLWNERADLISKKDLVTGTTLLLKHKDLAPSAIYDLRNWKQWECTDQVLDLFAQKTQDLPLIRRAILMFALQSPQARAAAFVREQRQRDPDWVKDTEELLKHGY